MKKSLTSLIVLASAFCMFSCAESNSGDDPENACQTNFCEGTVANICQNGKIVTTLNCGPAGCLNGVCLPSTNCIANAIQCSISGVPQKCIGNAWVDQTPCANGQTCSAGTCIGGSQQVCIENAIQCSISGVPQKCIGNAWVDQTPCANGQTCSAGTCIGGSQVVCTENATQCSALGIPQKCIGNAWVDQTPCANGQTCSAGNCIGGSQVVCTENATQCSISGVPQKCIGNAWVDQTPCANGQTCSAGTCIGGSQVVCTENAVQCSASGIPQKCIGNAWVDQTPCANGQTCSAGNCIGGSQVVCTENAVQCSASGIPQKCIGKTWVDQTPCANGQTCSAGNCIGGMSEDALCKNVKCDQSETCTGGVCVPTEMLNAKEGTPCKDEWYAEYCNTDGNAVYCAYDDSRKLVVTEEKCATGCKVGYSDEEYEGEIYRSYYSACVDETIISQCKEAEMNIVYCATYGDFSYMSAYECLNAVGGGFSVLDAMNYGVAIECKGTCNASMVMCEGMCESDADCSGETPYCDDNRGYCEACIYLDENKKCKDPTKACVLKDGNTSNYTLSCEDASAAVCKPETCATADKNNYSGNICVEIAGNKVCGCQSQNDCRDGYECNETVGTCTEIEAKTCTSDNDCSGSTPYCDIIYGICAECIMYSETQKCKDSTKVCMLNDNSEYYCEDAEIAACKPDKCTAAADANYTGNVCVEIFGNMECGCESQSDCREGYECDTTYNYCYKSEVGTTCTKDSDCSGSKPYCDTYIHACAECIQGSANQQCKDSSKECLMDMNTYEYYCGTPIPCDASECAAKTGDDYIGNACVEGYCGCESDDDCKSGYECNTSYYYCKKTSAAGSTAGSFDGKTLDGFSHSTGQDYAVTHTKTLDNGAVITIKGNFQNGTGLYMNDTSFIEVTGLNSVSKITMTYSSSKTDNGFTLTAGSYVKPETGVTKTEVSQTYNVTDNTAKSFKIDGALKQAMIIKSVSWE